MPLHPRRLAVATLACLIPIAGTGCSNQATTTPDEDTAAQPVGHVHGLGTDPGDGTLYVASHYGVFRVADGSVTRVAERWQDTMAFTVIGPGHFLASGHPDMREDLPVHLDLIESTDGAETWTPVSLEGEADFHALEATPEVLYGYDSASGSLLVTDDRQSWRILTKQPTSDLAADPTEPDHLLFTTPNGALMSLRRGAEPQQLNAPRLLFIDWPTPDLLVGVAPDGQVYASHDQADSRQSAGKLAGQVEALDVTADRWHVATSHGVFASNDGGGTWVAVLDHQP